MKHLGTNLKNEKMKASFFKLTLSFNWVFRWTWMLIPICWTLITNFSLKRECREVSTPLLLTKHPPPPHGRQGQLPFDWRPTHVNSHHQNFTSLPHFLQYSFKVFKTNIKPYKAAQDHTLHWSKQSGSKFGVC